MITTKQEYIDAIVKSFNEHIGRYGVSFNHYFQNETSCDEKVDNWLSDIRELGLTIGQPYHAHGIGNNNEYQVYLQELVGGDFIVEKKVAKIHITYGIYGGISIWLEDYKDGHEIVGIHFAR